MKHFPLYLIVLSVACMAACTKTTKNENFDISVQTEEYSDSTIFLTGERQTVTAVITPESAEAAWKVTSPTKDSWCTCYSEEDNVLTISVSDNQTSLPRESYAVISIGTTHKKLRINQDYIKYLNFFSAENVIDPSSGIYQIPLSTNVENSSITASAEEGCTWISALSIQNNTLSFSASRNPSKVDSRSANITLSSGRMTATIKIVQVPMSGYPYIISLAGLSLSTNPVYEIWDDVHSVKIGEICREYLYKYSPNEDKDIVNGSYTVAYPMYEGKVNYTKGLVLDNGGQVSWNTTISASTGGSNYIAAYTEGAATSFPATIYLPAGATSMRLEPLSSDEEEVVNAACRPMSLTDNRSGAANSQGETSESNTYSVVKIGPQYWIQSNLRTSRFASGEPIPTGFDNATWADRLNPILKPGCLVSGTSSSSTFIDANDPAGATTRAEYGCLYNYAAIVNQEIDVSKSSAVSFTKTDKISPAGWKVPTREEMIILYSYASQRTYASYTAETAEVLPKFLSTGTNETGFSAKGSRQRGLTGGYNAILYYSTIDYSYEGSTHGSYQLRLRDGNYSFIYLVALGSGTYLRLLKIN